MNTSRSGHHRPTSYEIGAYVAIGVGVGVLIAAVVVMAVLVMRLLRKVRKEDAEESVTEGRDSGMTSLLEFLTTPSRQRARPTVLPEDQDTPLKTLPPLTKMPPPS